MHHCQTKTLQGGLTVLIYKSSFKYTPSSTPWVDHSPHDVTTWRKTHWGKSLIDRSVNHVASHRGEDLNNQESFWACRRNIRAPHSFIVFKVLSQWIGFRISCTSITLVTSSWFHLFCVRKELINIWWGYVVQEIHFEKIVYIPGKITPSSENLKYR